jgi:transposase
VGSEGSASAVRLLGLEGFEVLEVREVDGELRVWVQTPARPVGCPSCGVRAESKGRPVVRVRDQPACGRPVVLCWVKRRWRCPERACPRRSWTTDLAARGAAGVADDARPAGDLPAGG